MSLTWQGAVFLMLWCNGSSAVGAEEGVSSGYDGEDPSLSGMPHAALLYHFQRCLILANLWSIDGYVSVT